jgi:hypothetical protein
MEPLLAWAFLAVVVERTIEIFTKLFPILDDINLQQFNVKMFIGLILGGLVSFGAGLDFFNMVNITFAIPYVGMAVSAVFIMAGSNYIHDILSAINRTRDSENIVIVEVERQE